MSSDHESLRDLVDAHALGALSDADRVRFEAHLATCAECRRDAQLTASTLEALGRSLPPQEPPPALRARVLAAATAATPRLAPVERRPVRMDRRTLPAWMAVAASIAALVGGMSAWNYKNDAARTRDQLAAVQRQMDTMAAHIATLEATATNAQRTSTILTAADLARVDLSGQSSAPIASGRVFWSPSSGLVFSATNLPALPPGHVYQLWIVAEAPRSAGILVPDAAGRLSVVSDAPVAVRPKAFALTIEPDGGRPAPTGAMFLLGSV